VQLPAGERTRAESGRKSDGRGGKDVPSSLPCLGKNPQSQVGGGRFGMGLRAAGSGRLLAVELARSCLADHTDLDRGSSTRD